MKDLAEFLLKTFPSAQYASGKNEIVMKCPFCGDSKDPKSKHFYISVVEGKPHFYNCFKCNSKGILNSKLLKQMSVYDIDAGKELDQYNKSLSSRISDTEEYRKRKIQNTYIRNEKISKIKLDYVNNRLGTNLTFQDAIQLKLVLNLGDLLDSNNIQKYTRDIKIVKQLDENFVGFLSFDNSTVVLRNISDKDLFESINKRYINYKIFDTDGIKQYIIPSRVDTISQLPVTIHIAEGPFDILSVFLNLNNGNNYQNIYSSITGNNYLSQVKYFLNNYGFINSIIHLYVDNDVTQYSLRTVKEYVNFFGIQLYIHRNGYTGQKDFGVAKNLIKDIIF